MTTERAVRHVNIPEALYQLVLVGGTLNPELLNYCAALGWEKC